MPKTDPQPRVKLNTFDKSGKVGKFRLKLGKFQKWHQPVKCRAIRRYG